MAKCDAKGLDTALDAELAPSVIEQALFIGLLPGLVYCRKATVPERHVCVLAG
jgi:hypothetical protein